MQYGEVKYIGFKYVLMNSFSLSWILATPYTCWIHEMAHRATNSIKAHLDIPPFRPAPPVSNLMALMKHNSTWA